MENIDKILKLMDVDGKSRLLDINVDLISESDMLENDLNPNDLDCFKDSIKSFQNGDYLTFKTPQELFDAIEKEKNNNADE